jgi:hypothetical protein
MYLVRINQKGGIEEADDGVYLVPEFMRLIEAPKYGLNAFKCVALNMDYESPFRFQEEGVAKQNAITQSIYGKKDMKFWKDAAILEAQAAYEFLQYDPIREHLKALTAQLKAFDDLLKKPTTKIEEIEQRLKVMKQVSILRAEINKVREEVATSVKTVKIKGNKLMSWLEERHFKLAQQFKTEMK